MTCILQEIPSNGIDKWFKLEGRSPKSRVDGDCHIKITLTTGKVYVVFLIGLLQNKLVKVSLWPKDS